MMKTREVNERRQRWKTNLGNIYRVGSSGCCLFRLSSCVALRLYWGERRGVNYVGNVGNLECASQTFSSKGFEIEM